MMKWFRKKDKEEHQQEPEEIVQIACKGTYSLAVAENKKELEAQERVSYWQRDYYTPYKVIVTYDVVVKYDNVEYNLSDSYIFKKEVSERRAYMTILGLITDEGDRLRLMENLERRIVEELNEHLRNNNIEKVKKFLESNKTFDIDFTIEREKSSIEEFSI